MILCNCFERDELLTFPDRDLFVSDLGEIGAVEKDHLSLEIGHTV